MCISLFLSLSDIHTHTHLLQTPRCTIIVSILYTIAVGHKQFREKDCTVGSGYPYKLYNAQSNFLFSNSNFLLSNQVGKAGFA